MEGVKVYMRQAVEKAVGTLKVEKEKEKRERTERAETVERAQTTATTTSVSHMVAVQTAVAKDISWDMSTKNKDIAIQNNTVSRIAISGDGYAGVMGSRSLAKDRVSRWECRVNKSK